MISFSETCHVVSCHDNALEKEKTPSHFTVPEGSPVGVVVVVDHTLDVIQPRVGGADVLGGAGVPDVALQLTMRWCAAL